MTTSTSKRRKPPLSVRPSVKVKQKAVRAARKLKISRNAFIVLAIEEKADAVLASADRSLAAAS